MKRPLTCVIDLQLMVARSGVRGAPVCAAALACAAAPVCAAASVPDNSIAKAKVARRNLNFIFT